MRRFPDDGRRHLTEENLTVNRLRFWLLFIVVAITNSVVVVMLEANNDPQVFYVISFIVFYAALGRFCYERALDAGKKPVGWVGFGLLTGIGFVWLGCLKSAKPPLLTVQDKPRRALHTAHRLFRTDSM